MADTPSSVKSRSLYSLHCLVCLGCLFLAIRACTGTFRPTTLGTDRPCPHWNQTCTFRHTHIHVLFFILHCTRHLNDRVRRVGVPAANRESLISRFPYFFNEYFNALILRESHPVSSPLSAPSYISLHQLPPPTNKPNRRGVGTTKRGGERNVTARRRIRE